MAGEEEGGRADEAATPSVTARKVHNIVKFHYRRNNASLIRRATPRASLNAHGAL